MKVLYFMTTPPTHPSLKKMVKGVGEYSAFFLENEIVWAANQAVREQVDILGNSVEVIGVPEPPYTLEAIFDQLPDGWEPDVVFFNNVEGITFPENIWECPYPVAVIANDLHVATLHNPDVYNLIDGIVAITPLPSKLQSHSGLFYSHCGTAKIPSGIQELRAFSQRPVDVLSVCSKMLPAYMERNKILGKVATLLGDSRRICYPSLRDMDIHTPHRFAKIVVDHSFLNVSGRAYEAMLNGCLFFCHEGNTLISNSLEPFVHYVPYNDENIVDLIERYLDDEEASTAIITAAMAFLENKPCTHGDIYNDCLAKAMAIMDKEERQIRVSAMSIEAKKAALATNLASYSTYWGIPKPKHWLERYFQLSRESVESEGSDLLRAKRLLEAGRVAALSGDNRKAESLLAKATWAEPALGWAWAIRAQVAYQEEQYDDAMDFATVAINSCHDSPRKVSEIGLPLSVDDNWLQWLAWGSYLQHIDESRREDQVKSCLALSYKIKSDILLRQGNEKEALECLIDCVHALPIIREHVFELVCFLQKNGDISEALFELETGLEQSPYSYMLLEKKIELLNGMERFDEAEIATLLLKTMKRCYSRDYFFELTGLSAGSARA